MSRNKTCMMVGAALAALLSGAAMAQDRYGKETLLGLPAAAGDPVDKVVTIEPNTRWVNINQDEVVKFVVGGRDFTWRFESNMLAVNLKDIAPAGAVDRNIFVYLTPDPLYAGD